MNLQELRTANSLVEARRQLIMRKEGIEKNGVNVYAGVSSELLHGRDSPLQNRFAEIAIDHLAARIVAIEIDLARLGINTEEPNEHESD